MLPVRFYFHSYSIMIVKCVQKGRGPMPGNFSSRIFILSWTSIFLLHFVIGHSAERAQGLRHRILPMRRVDKRYAP